MLFEALTFQLGYNATLVTLGAMLLGGAAGVTGTFLYLRKRSLVSDAIAHATLPGVGLAFIAMTWAGLDGRSLPGLLAGSAVTALLGLLAVQWLAARTRLFEDAAIGAVLSVFFGFGMPHRVASGRAKSKLIAVCPSHQRLFSPRPNR